MGTLSNEQFALDFKKIFDPYYQKLSSIAEELECDKDSYAPFLTQWGNKFPLLPKSNRIMFYGRATNGWENDGWLITDMLGDSPDEINQQLKWVEQHRGDSNYNSNQSQFWKVIMGVTKEIFKGDDADIEHNWWRYPSWSNLCKVAPEESGNPNSSDYDATWDINKKIFDAELQYFDPGIVVFLTGEDWACDFFNYAQDASPLDAKKLGIVNWDPDYDNRTLSIYQQNGRFYIVSLHPQGKKVNLHILGLIQAIMKVAPECFKRSTSSVAKLMEISSILQNGIEEKIENYYSYPLPFIRIMVDSTLGEKIPVAIQTSINGKPYFGVKLNKYTDHKLYQTIKEKLSPYFKQTFQNLQYDDDYWPVWEYLRYDGTLSHYDEAVSQIKSFINHIKNL